MTLLTMSMACEKGKEYRMNYLERVTSSDATSSLPLCLNLSGLLAVNDTSHGELNTGISSLVAHFDSGAASMPFLYCIPMLQPAGDQLMMKSRNCVNPPGIWQNVNHIISALTLHAQVLHSDECMSSSVTVWLMCLISGRMPLDY